MGVNHSQNAKFLLEEVEGEEDEEPMDEEERAYQECIGKLQGFLNLNGHNVSAADFFSRESSR